jgi:hypothetical protein
MDLRARKPHDPEVMVLTHLTLVPTILRGKIGHINFRKESNDSFRNQCKTYELVQGGMLTKSISIQVTYVDSHTRRGMFSWISA